MRVRTAVAARCLLCDEPAPSRALCAACWSELPWLDAPCCEQCAQPLAAPDICGRCLADPPHFDAVAAACRYRFPVDGLIQSCKYGGRLATIRALAAMLVHRPPHRPDLIVPMPLSPQRLRERGFNQALELARAVEPFIKAPVDAGLRENAGNPASDPPAVEGAPQKHARRICRTG